jgi:phosphoribosylanthranilate isomerase
VEREVEDIREPSKSTLGFISASRSRRSAKGSTLRRWIAAMTPAAVRPPSRNFYKACRIGWSFS